MPHSEALTPSGGGSLEALTHTFDVTFSGPKQRALTGAFCRTYDASTQTPSDMPTVGSPNIRPHHLIDYLARSYAVVPEEATYLADDLGVCSVALRLPECHQCRGPARFDTWATDRRPAMFLCGQCIDLPTETRLGLGTATYLVRETEVPLDVAHTCDGVATELGRETLWSDARG